METCKPPANVDTAFRQLCGILFGSEAGPLADYSYYLKEAMMPYAIAKSEGTGKDVFLSNPYYPKKARFAAQSELENAKAAISINDAKDIDSLFRAASESMVYCGNKVFGRNANTELVDNAIDCIDVYYSHNVRNVKRGAFISYVRESECVFGIPAFPKIRYSMRCLEGINANRMFETYYTNNSSDMYYSFNCNNCSECMFCFNLRAKKHAIGNLELEKGRYMELKKKLAAEMAGMLKKNKRLPALSDFAAGGRGANSGEKGELIPTVPAPASVEKAWSETTGIVTGRQMKKISDYEPWLQARALKVFRLKGRGGKLTYKPYLPLVRDIPAATLCTREEAMKMCEPMIGEAEAGLGFAQLGKKITPDAYITMEMMEGECMEVPEVTQAIDSTESWSMWDATSSSRSACTTAAIQSKYAFGGFFRVLDSEFAINCYDIVECRRCLEVDSSSRCSDCYFCHNCEACENCILCSNSKGLRFAVLNKEVGKEKYMEIRAMLLSYIADRLEKEKGLDKSIFDL